MYNTIIPSPLSAERDNSRQLAGGNARARNSEGIIMYNTSAVIQFVLSYCDTQY